MSIEYTEEQQRAIDMALDAFRSGKKLFRIGGYAGTGKTTILRAIDEAFPGLAMCAYTGKAASVLRGKGIEATTIHRRVYTWSEEYQEFHRVQSVNYTGFGIDEGSMVGGDIYRDIEAFGLPILAVGDPGQLEPISSKDLNLMKDPDVVLEKIHRQAEGNPIIELATKVRKRQPWGYQETDDRCLVLKKAAFWDEIMWADVALCGYNRTRVQINKRIRYKKKYSNPIEEGEKLVCLQNDPKFGVFNGLGFEVIKVRESNNQYLRADLKADDGTFYDDFPIWDGCFNEEKPPDWKTLRRFQGKALIGDYGNAMTVHKYQGSESNKVAVIDEQAPKLWCPVRHRYTSYTRASKNLRVYKDPPETKL